jgi:hypothetical protein
MLSEQPKSKLDNLVLYKLPKDQIQFFDEMAESFWKLGAIRRPNRHALGKLAILYLGGMWKQDIKRRAAQAQQSQELDKQTSPITKLDDDGPMFTTKTPPPTQKDKYW